MKRNEKVRMFAKSLVKSADEKKTIFGMALIVLLDTGVISPINPLFDYLMNSGLLVAGVGISHKIYKWILSLVSDYKEAVKLLDKKEE